MGVDNRMLRDSRFKSRTRLFAFVMSLIMAFSVFLPFPQVAFAGVSAGASGDITAKGSIIGRYGGISHMDELIFRVGLSRHPSFYNDREHLTFENMRKVWKYSFAPNEESVFFIPAEYTLNGVTYNIQKTFYDPVKWYVGKYDPSKRNIDLYDDQQNKDRVKFLPVAPASKPTLPLKSTILTEIKKNGKRWEDFADNNWKTLLGLNNPENLKKLREQTLSVWAWITEKKKQFYNGPVGGKTDYGLHIRIDEMIDDAASEFGKRELDDDQKLGIRAGYTAMLIGLWSLMPPDIQRDWEIAINDYLTGEGQKRGYDYDENTRYEDFARPGEFYSSSAPVTIYIDLAVTLSFAERGKTTRVILPLLDYFENYTKVGTANSLTTFRDPVTESNPGTASGFINQNTQMNANPYSKALDARGYMRDGAFERYDLLWGLVYKDIVEASNVQRYSTQMDFNNVFTFSAAAITYPKGRFESRSNLPGWKGTDLETAILEVFNVGKAGQDQHGFMYVNFSAISGGGGYDADIDVFFEVTPEFKQLNAGEEVIGENVLLTFTHNSEYVERINDWEKVFASDPNLTEVTIKITPNRKAPNATLPPSYISAEGDYTVGVTMTKDNFLKWIKGQETITLSDKTSNQPIAEESTIVYTYEPTFEVIYTYKGKQRTLQAKPTPDSATFKRPKNPPELIAYHSEPSAYAEFKNGTPDNEEFEAMAGVPSNKRLYLGVGGSEFIVDVELEYKENVDSVWRTYRSYFSGTASEFKAGDTAGPKQLGGYTVDTYNGGTYTKTWTGSIPNLAQPVTKSGSGTVTATTTAQPDMTAYNQAKNEALAYVNQVNSTQLCHTSASDKVTRCYNNWGAKIVTDVANKPRNTSASDSCYTPNPQGGQTPCPVTVTAYPDGPGDFTITVTFTVPPHIIDGPESTNDMPGVEDTWKQRINFDYMKIIRVEVYKIEEGRIYQVEGVFGDNKELKATIQQGEPNIFVNIAQMNAGGNDVAAQSSKHGRIRYTLEPNQHDTVVWYEGVRSNKSDGMGAHGQTLTGAPQGGGHIHPWATGILYTRPAKPEKGDEYATKLDTELHTSEVKRGYSDLADAKDRDTMEYRKFLERRRSTNKASIISDMLILQTSSGDQAVLYFHKDSAEVQAQQQFPDVRATKEEMWDNNPYSAANWKPNQIYVGSYNGQYQYTGNGPSNNKKYWGLNQVTNTLMDNAPTGENSIRTRFDDLPAGKVRPARPSKLYIYGVRDIIPTTPNGAYHTGGAEVFYERILQWTSPNAYEEYPGLRVMDPVYTPKAQSGFGNKQGLVFKAPYSDNHVKVNDIIIHTPVTTEYAMVVALPEYRDQRTELPAGGAAALIEDLNTKPDTGYVPDVELANIDFENYTSNTIFNKTTGKYIPYYTSPGITIGPQSGFGSGNVLKAFGTRWSLDLSDLGVTYSDGVTLYVEMDLWIPSNQSGQSMIVSFNRYDFYLPNVTGNPTWNTGNGWERRLDNVTLFDKKVKLGLEFSFKNLDQNRVFIDGVLQKAYTRVNSSSPITSEAIGNRINIGSWNTNDSYPAKFYVDNLRIVMKGYYPGINYTPKSTKVIDTTASSLKTILTTISTIKTIPGASGSATFNYTGAMQTFVAPESGTYTLEVWGAQGGKSQHSTSDTNKGGYSKGQIYLNKGEVLYIYVGGKGEDNGPAGGFNGGGSGYNYSSDSAGGGGATHIAKASGLLKDLVNNKSAVLIVAGGGGGNACTNDVGGAGGGLTGGDGVGPNYMSPGKGGTQTAGGASGGGYSTAGSFGQGGSVTGGYGGGGGGGGWYGGGAGGVESGGGNAGGGGSSYIGGVQNGTTQAGVNSGHGKAVISYNIQGQTEKTTTTQTTVLGPYVSTSQTVLSVAGDDGYKGYTWEQLLGPNWRSYFVTATNEETTVDKNTSSSSKKIDPPKSQYLGVANNFSYTGNVQEFVAPEKGKYALEVWGAQGGASGANGGYSRGVVSLEKGEKLYVYVGGQGTRGTGTNGTISGGWNGGGSVLNAYADGNNGSGGGATDIRRVGGAWNNTASLNSRLIVAGGGGGGVAPIVSAGYGGGFIGGTGEFSSSIRAEGGSQSGGGYGNYASGTLGKGADGPRAGAGGGYYGGGVSYGGSTTSGAMGGGGSGYIGGVSFGLTLAGNESMPNPNGGTMTGKTGHGYARITLVEDEYGNRHNAFWSNVTTNTPVTLSYTGSVQTYTAPHTGEYLLEVWGAQGGNLIETGYSPYSGSTYGVGGKGGYSKGKVTLNEGETLYIYVGGKGNGTSGGWNGGGAGRNAGAGGGGATDIRKGGTTLDKRIIVAGGGGGAQYGDGGAGGGTNGMNSPSTVGGNSASSFWGTPGTGGGQTLSTGSGQWGVGQDARTGNDGLYGGAGGGGYVGGGSAISDTSRVDDYGGAGGSGYIGGVTEGQTIAGNQSMPAPNGGTQVGNSGHGVAKITPLSSGGGSGNTTTEITETTTIDTTVTNKITTYSEVLNEPKVRKDLHLFPDWMPDGEYNPLKIAFGYPDPTPPSPLETPVYTPEGNALRLATFINIDYGFQIYFPNLGDFAQQPNLQGIGALTVARGKGFYNNMDTTQYTARKRVRMPFNVIFNGTLYTSGTWIDLPVNQSYYDFYAVLANREASAALIEFDVAPINGRPIGGPYSDNYVKVNNKDRFTNFWSYHGGYKKSYIDVVGRIGNFVVMDTDDFRLSNLFKKPDGSGEWVVEGIVSRVDPYQQNRYYGDLVDIRGVCIHSDVPSSVRCDRSSNNGKMLNTWGTQDWLEQRPLQFPVNANDNAVEPLQEEFIKPGYNILADISTIGNYQLGVVRALPYYYKLDLDTGQITPLDVYTRNGQTYQLVNKYRGADNGTLPEDLYEYDMIINWENEAGRRNYTPDEATVTERVSDTRVDYIYGLAPDPEGDIGEGVVDTIPLPIPKGTYIDIGNAQRVVAQKEARTFIGTERTYGVNMNLGSRLEQILWDEAAQRWHLKFGIPSSALFVEAGMEPTEENFKRTQQGNAVVLLAVDIISIGELFTLRWDQPGITSVRVKKDGQTRVFNIANVGIPPVVALYDMENTARIDVTPKGSH